MSSPLRARISAFGFHFPGDQVEIASLPLTPDERDRLPRLGQAHTFISAEDSTALMVHAARAALERCGRPASALRMVISAPSLMTSYGLEIPAVALRAQLGLVNAQCLNLAQGCVGVLRAIELAAELLAGSVEGGDILVVTSCRASAHTRNMNHGAFFWGDAAAAVVLSATPGPGPRVEGYAEAAADTNWGAMRIELGDASGPPPDAAHHGQIAVSFPTKEDQIDYIRGEQARFARVVDALLAAQGLVQEDISAIFVPSTGKNRAPILFSAHRALRDRLATDFRCGHLGGVDPILSLFQYLQGPTAADGAWMMALSPAFAAQWGGLLLRNRS